MKFQTHECPLCGEVLRFGKLAGVSTYYCRNAGIPGGNNKSHYEVEIDAKESIQHMYAFPYAVDNFANATRSRVYKWQGSRWQLLKEVPLVNPRPHDELLKHLRTFIPE